MKNTILFLLFCIVLLVLSCSKNTSDQEIKITKGEISRDISTDETKDDFENNSAKEQSSLKTITSKEVRKHIGDSLIVKGYVADIYLSDKVAYLNFENKFPRNIFSCTVFSVNFGEFGDLSKFKGKNVEITGKISTYKSKPQVILNSKDQIKIIQ